MKLQTQLKVTLRSDFENGYDSLMQALRAEAESYGARFRLNTMVKKIRWASEEVTVACEPAAEYSASTIVVTVPLSILQRDSKRRRHRLRT